MLKSLKPVSGREKNLFRMHKVRGGFNILRRRIAGTTDLRYDFSCTTCGKTQVLRCSMYEEPKFDYSCECKPKDSEGKSLRAHNKGVEVEKFKKENMVMVCAEYGWLLAAKSCHDVMVSKKYKIEDRHIRLYHFGTFLKTLLDLCRSRGHLNIDPSSIIAVQPTHGLVLDNVGYSLDVLEVWPDIKKVALYYRMQSHK